MTDNSNNKYQWIGHGRNYFQALGDDHVVTKKINTETTPTDETTTNNDDENNDKDINNNNKNKQTVLISSSANTNKFLYNTNNASDNNGYYQHHCKYNQKYNVTCSSSATFFQKNDHRVEAIGTVHGHVWNKTNPITITIPYPLPIAELAAGRHFLLARLQGGLAVVTWGAGHFGQLGIGASTSTSGGGGGQQANQVVSIPSYCHQPQILERLLPHIVGSSIRQVAAGDWHACALTESGTVWSWGCNRNGQCGRKPNPEMVSASGAMACIQRIPMPVDPSSGKNNDNGDVRFTKVQCGRSHTVALSDKRQVYCWGASGHGQCGTITRRRGIYAPRKIEHGLQTVAIEDIAVGENHNLALTTGGRVFSWGCNHEGQLGILLFASSNDTNSAKKYYNDDNSTGSVSILASTFPPGIVEAAQNIVLSAYPKPKLISDLDFVAIAAEEEWRKNKKGNNKHNKKQQQKQQGGKQGKQQQQKEDEKQQQKENGSKQKDTENSKDNNTTNSEPKDKDNDSKPFDEAENDNNVRDQQNSQAQEEEGEEDDEEHKLASVHTITAIYAAGNYSMALSSSGHVYGWGSNDTGVLGLSVITQQQTSQSKQDYEDDDLPPPRILDVQTFDSKHNVLLPRRLDSLRHLKIESISCGPCHAWFHGTKRPPPLKTTEEEEEKDSVMVWQRTSQSEESQDATTSETNNNNNNGQGSNNNDSSKGDTDSNQNDNNIIDNSSNNNNNSNYTSATKHPVTTTATMTSRLLAPASATASATASAPSVSTVASSSSLSMAPARTETTTLSLTPPLSPTDNNNNRNNSNRVLAATATASAARAGNRTPTPTQSPTQCSSPSTPLSQSNSNSTNQHLTTGSTNVGSINSIPGINPPFMSSSSFDEAPKRSSFKKAFSVPNILRRLGKGNSKKRRGGAVVPASRTIEDDDEEITGNHDSKDDHDNDNNNNNSNGDNHNNNNNMNGSAAISNTAASAEATTAATSKRRSFQWSKRG